MTESVVSFTSPPVVEVVAGVSFDVEPAELDAVLGAFWKDRLKQRFPRIQRQAPYLPALEQFSSDLLVAPSAIPLAGAPYLPARLWAMTEDEQELLQLQPGYFACNWRKFSPDIEYDRWPNRRETFRQWYTEFKEYLADADIPQLNVRQCEVTYINHIESDLYPDHGSLFAKAFTLSPNREPEYEFEMATSQFQFLVNGDDGSKGRLYVKALPGFSKKGEAVYVLELTVRGMPAGQELPELMGFFDNARRAIVKSFVSLTSVEMHEKWGIQR